MSELTNPEISDETAAKMKRMAIAIKAVGGWFSYFTGISLIAFGTLTEVGVDLFIVTMGLVICLAGIILLHIHIKQKELQGKARIVKGIKYIGALLFIPGLLGGILPFDFSPELKPFFIGLFLVGLVIFIASFILRNKWGLKPPKKIRKTEGAI